VHVSTDVLAAIGAAHPHFAVARSDVCTTAGDGLTDERLTRVRLQGLYVMHPGPVNRGVELTDNVMTYERSLINQQVENGIAVRMSVLYWLRPGAGC
jgi:aspartate carbamoyltransferase catalytic subunit